MFKMMDKYLKSGSGSSSIRLIMMIQNINGIIFTDIIIVATFWLINNGKTISESILIALLSALALNAGVATTNKVMQKKHQINGEKECTEEKKDEGKGKVEDVKTENKKGKKGKETTPALSESNKGILEMLGLKMPSKEGDKKEGEGEGGDEKGKGKGKGKGTTTGSAEVDKTLEELGFKKPKEESGGTKGKESKTEKKETKLDEKVSTNTGKKTETSTTNTPIKETTTQNLSSVNTPTTDKAEDKKEDTKTTTNTTTSTENKTEDKKSDTDVKTEEVQQKEEGNKEKTGDQDKMIKELGDNMKSMVTLLSQLNNTMKNPLIVIPNGKKFH